MRVQGINTSLWGEWTGRAHMGSFGVDEKVRPLGSEVQAFDIRLSFRICSIDSIAFS